MFLSFWMMLTTLPNFPRTKMWSQGTLEESNSSMASANGQSFPLENVLQKINSLIDPRANASLNQSAEKYLDRGSNTTIASSHGPHTM